jgi:hypothetical protein
MANIALTTSSTQIALSDLCRIAAAVQRQINEHLPAEGWALSATITALAPNQVPNGYWRISVQPLEGDALGQHFAVVDSSAGAPYAIVSDKLAFDDLSVTVSHEALEMLADSSLNQFVAAQVDGVGAAVMLKEICDPCQNNSYQIDGVFVCDFAVSDYYNSGAARPWFTHCGEATGIAAPFGLAVGGSFVYRILDGTGSPEGNFVKRVRQQGSDNYAEVIVGQDLAGSGLAAKTWVDAMSPARVLGKNGVQYRRKTLRSKPKKRNLATPSSVRWQSSVARRLRVLSKLLTPLVRSAGASSEHTKPPKAAAVGKPKRERRSPARSHRSPPKVKRARKLV